ncbi:MAG: phage/plasmid primase, P4 family [Rhodospirillales bacterium]|nr:phage/plasmid primase, P4 family [Rhodospirillales bacterium]
MQPDGTAGAEHAEDMAGPDYTFSESPQEPDAAVIKRLAALPLLEYDRCRKPEAKQLGVQVSTLDRQVEAARRSASSAGGSEARAPEWSDEALALRFSARHADELRYVAAWGRWYRWTGTVWREDDTLRVFDLARSICREAAAQCEDGGTAPRIASAQTVAAVERLARADRRHAATADQWDGDPWLLNTPGGVVDLRTGTLREHQRNEYLTKTTSVAPAERADCPRWLQFLDEITRGDADTIAFLQRAIGYSLTGDIREHAFFFLHGPGGNGKGVLLCSVGDMLGDYARAALQSVVTVSRGDQHPTEIVALRGARFVSVPEVEDGRAWAEARLKGLTGGDVISARVMRGDPFDFRPACKLWIVGNHRPVLRNPDPAMRRRMHLVPMTYVPPVPDLELPERLRGELPGILRWAIDGCFAWQRQGLDPPATVRAATDSYFAEQDSIAAWIEERTERQRGAELGSRMAYIDWRGWATARGDDPGSERRFSAEMERYAARRKTNHGRVFLDLRLLSTETGVWNG